MIWTLALIYCAAVWGSTFYLVKQAIAGIHPVALVAYRFLIAAALMLPWIARRPGGFRLRLLGEAAGLSAILLGLYVSQTIGLRWTSASNSGFITGLFVAFVPLLLYASRRQVPTVPQRFALGFALAGLWLLTGGPAGVNAGDALTLVAALTYAGHLLWSDRCVRAGGDVVWLVFHQFWMTGAVALLAAAAGGLPLAVRDGWTRGAVAFLAVVPTLSAFFVQMAAQRHVDPVRASLVFSLEPVFAALFAWTLGGETTSLASAAGGALIVAAMVVAELPIGRAAKRGEVLEGLSV